jgi:hypothetical protein
MEADKTVDSAAQARQARFGKLPEPIPRSALIAEILESPRGIDDFNPEKSWLHYSCLALDLGFF